MDAEYLAGAHPLCRRYMQQAEGALVKEIAFKRYVDTRWDDLVDDYYNLWEKYMFFELATNPGAYEEFVGGFPSAWREGKAVGWLIETNFRYCPDYVKQWSDPDVAARVWLLVVWLADVADVEGGFIRAMVCTARMEGAKEFLFPGLSEDAEARLREYMDEYEGQEMLPTVA